MRVVWNRPEARWLPSRFHFAIFRLPAWLFLTLRAEEKNRRHPRGTMPEDSDRLALAIDRDQTAVEQYGVAVWLLLVLSAYLTAFVTTRWRMGPLAVVLTALFAPLATAALIEIEFFAVSFLIPPLRNAITGRKAENNIGLNSVAQMSVLFLTSISFAGVPGWARPIAWATISLFALNGAAALVLLAMRNRLDALDREYGGRPSAL